MIGRTDLIPFMVSMSFLVVGVTAWGLIEHSMTHWRATDAGVPNGLDGRWFVDRGTWWYQP